MVKQCYFERFNPDDFDWAALATGDSGDVELERQWLRKAHDVFVIFCQKQHDYGPNNIATGGAKGVGLRIGDKTSRLFQLLGINDNVAKEAVVSESLMDTAYDLADYGLILALVLDGKWHGDTPEMAWGIEAVRKILSEMEYME